MEVLTPYVSFQINRTATNADLHNTIQELRYELETLRGTPHPPLIGFNITPLVVVSSVTAEAALPRSRG